MRVSSFSLVGMSLTLAEWAVSIDLSDLLGVEGGVLQCEGEE